MSVLLNKSENRSDPRFPLRLDVRVEAKTGQNITWKEVAPIKDASAYGAGVILKRPIKRGRIIHLTLDMPTELRRYDLDVSDYKVWGIVRRCLPVNKEKSVIGYATGIAFIGETPPDGFERHPGRLYSVSYNRTESDGFWRVIDPASLSVDGSDRVENRKETRFAIPEELTLEVLDESRNVISSENTVTANISQGGAIVFTQFYAEVGTFLRVRSLRCGIDIISIVRGRLPGPSDTARLNIEFIDRTFPLKGIV